MGAFFRGRTPPAAALAALTAAVLLLAGKTAPAGLPGPEELPIMGREAAEAALLGLPRQEILNAWGEPDGSLSGFFGDIYQLESGMCITVYYDPEPMNRGAANSCTVPVQDISCPAIPPAGGGRPVSFPLLWRAIPVRRSAPPGAIPTER